jgi:xanthine dehydrogenase accessory factor
MGCRRTNDARAEALKAEGVTDEQLARVKAPIGLDIGSRTPEEVAIAVAAEVVGTFRKKRKREAVGAAGAATGGP